ncbi:DUF1129 family protein [Bacillus sp. SD088]|uniref:DUF1129 family protein n=1 Tax=Bacillus sp. SD088 TaxID=2782012 RepID=UPI001A95676C|nr:DUF1129 family protein [Bacillus sp. SD088]MBO0992614.1 DUF1129 family protein [Bacillus sp. SD088]
MDAKLLIEENNKKRKLLTKENEAYYDDLLVYIRLHFSLSEQQSEEVLMEMLDHLIEGQKEGKTAKDIFGDDPLSYTDEIIELLPKEKKRNIIPFVSGIVVNIISWVLIIRGIILVVLSQFTQVNTDINLLGATVVALAIGIFIIINIWFMLKLTKSSLFNEKRSLKKNMLKVVLFAAASMAVVLVIAKFTPDIGPSFTFNWWVSIILGAILWLLHFIVKKGKS